MMLKKNDLVTLTVESTTHDGSGVARAEGLAVFVPGATMGDEIEARIVKVNKSYAYGRLERLLAPSPNRVESPCPAFPKCGGCVFLNCNYQAELGIKAERVRSAFAKIGGFQELAIRPILPSPQEFFYRNKAQFPVSMGENGPILGFYASRSHRVVDGSSCRIQSAVINRAAAVFLEFLKQYAISIYDGKEGLVRHFYVRCAKDGSYMAVVVANGKKLPFAQELVELLSQKAPGLKTLVLNVNTKANNTVLGEKCLTLFGEGYLEDVLCGLRFRLSPLSFYQVNHPQAERLYGLVADYAALTGAETVLDLYCGAGTIGMTLAGRAKEVIGIEAVEAAVADAKSNAERNGIANIRFLCADAGQAAKTLLAQAVKADVVVVDPPRKGCDGDTLYAIRCMAPKRVVYMSCDCETLARDCKILAGYGYEIKQITPADMFPKTPHVECVTLLVREAGAN